MLAGDSVAEVGCGDAFGSRIVLQEVNCIDVYDFDPVFIDDIRQRHAQTSRWRRRFTISRPPSKQYDGIFSLDVISISAPPTSLPILETSVTRPRQRRPDPRSPSGIAACRFTSEQVGHINCKWRWFALMGAGSTIFCSR